MASSDRKTPAPDKNLLWAAAGGLCEFPDCRQVLVAHGGTKLVTVGEIAHIYAHSVGGPRFNASLAEKFVDSYDNWLLMCRKHHRIVDGDERAFSIDLLMQWKTARDDRFFRETTRSSFSHLASPPPLGQHLEQRVPLHDNLRSAIASGRAVVTGMAGSGKTQLAVQHFGEQADNYTFRWWIRGHSVDSIVSDLASLAPLLNLMPTQDIDLKGTADLVVAELGRRTDWFIVFDAVPRFELLDPYLPAGGDVLVTSQAAGWPGFKVINCGQMLPEESVNLLRQRLGHSEDEHNLSQVAHLCGHHPLTLAHVSGYMASRKLSSVRAIELLEDRLVDVLARGGGEPPQTLIAAVNLTQADLSTDAKALTHCLAALGPSPFPLMRKLATPKGVSHLWGDELALEDAVAELLRFSLVERYDEELLMHELVQRIIWASMTAEERHEAIHNASFQIVQSIPIESINLVTRSQFERILPHAHRVIDLMEGASAFSRIAAFLLNRIGTYYGNRHEVTYGNSLLRRGLTLLEGTQDYEGELDDDDWATKGSLIHNIGTTEYERGNLNEAEKMVREALAIKIAHAPLNDRLIAYSENFLATICHHKGAYAEAREYFISALRRFRAADVPVRIAGCLVDLAQLELEEGNQVAARSALEEARRLAEGHPEGADQLVRIYSMLADAHYADGNMVEALRMASGAVLLVKEFGDDDVNIVRALTIQGRLLMEAGNHVRALDTLHEAHEVLNATSDLPTIEEARARGNLGSALFHSGEIEDGMEELRRSSEDLASMLPPDHPTLHTAEQMLTNAHALLTEANAYQDSIALSVKNALADDD